jgi:hypothetical protein
VEGAAPPSPFAWIISRYCEEFGCGITQAIYDLENAPHGLISEVVDLRAFVQTKIALDSAKDAGDGPTGPMAERVWAAWKAVKDERREQRRGADSG